jgi:hypothetical protein
LVFLVIISYIIFSLPATSNAGSRTSSAPRGPAPRSTCRGRTAGRAPFAPVVSWGAFPSSRAPTLVAPDVPRPAPLSLSRPGVARVRVGLPPLLPVRTRVEPTPGKNSHPEKDRRGSTVSLCVSQDRFSQKGEISLHAPDACKAPH